MHTLNLRKACKQAGMRKILTLDPCLWKVSNAGVVRLPGSFSLGFFPEVLALFTCLTTAMRFLASP